jgi:hypothetical protein
VALTLEKYGVASTDDDDFQYDNIIASTPESLVSFTLCSSGIFHSFSSTLPTRIISRTNNDTDNIVENDDMTLVHPYHTTYISPHPYQEHPHNHQQQKLQQQQ